MEGLDVAGLKVSVEGEEIVKGVDISVKPGEIVALMGPNGSGKSSLSYALMGSPTYTIDGGKVIVNGEDITEMSADERSKSGLFLSFQYPLEIPGVSVSNFLRTAINAHRENPVDILEFATLLKEKMDLLKIDPSFSERSLNEGFSGGEKKRNEILQLLMLNPQIAVLDETDSGLDIDALKVVATGINESVKQGTGVLVITHYQRLLNYVKPSRVYVMKNGKIAQSGGPELVERLESEGYDWLEQ